MEKVFRRSGLFTISRCLNILSNRFSFSQRHFSTLCKRNINNRFLPANSRSIGWLLGPIPETFTKKWWIREFKIFTIFIAPLLFCCFGAGAIKIEIYDEQGNFYPEIKFWGKDFETLVLEETKEKLDKDLKREKEVFIVSQLPEIKLDIIKKD